MISSPLLGRATRVVKLALLAALVLIPAGGPARAEGNSPDVYQAANFTVIYRQPGGDEGACDTSGADGPLIAWPQEAKTAMNHVIDILDDLIVSGPPIVVDACFQAHNDATSLAYASAVTEYVRDYGVGNHTYAVALANARDNTDNNGAASEILVSVNQKFAWSYCTTNCAVPEDKNDFVSTVLHEFIHGLGFYMSFGVDNPAAPTLGLYSQVPTITDFFVYTSPAYAADPNRQLISLPNNSQAFRDIFLAGSGTVEFRGPATTAATGFSPFIYSVANSWEAGSSMSHLDDNHATDLGRLMNAATPSGPSSRTVDAVTLMFLKDIGWGISEASDYGDGSMTGPYGEARHINDKNFVDALWLGNDFTTEAPAITGSDSADDGVQMAGLPWKDGNNGGSVSLTVGGAANTAGCLSGWIDWTGNNSFADADDAVITMLPVTSGQRTLSFAVPAGTFPDPPTNKTLNARFRLLPDWDRDGRCDDQIAVRPRSTEVGGEVEEYAFPFGEEPQHRIFLPALTRITP